MNKYFSHKDCTDFFKDNKLSRFVWMRADQYLRDSKKIRRHGRLAHTKHKNIRYLEKHFKTHEADPKANKKSRYQAFERTEQVLSRMEEFKIYVGNLKF